MTLTTAPAPGTPLELEHDCDIVSHPVEVEKTRPSARPGRFLGVDAARGFALIGMIAVHTMSAATPDGDLSLPWLLFSGRSAALFAVLGGAGIAFMTGRARAPRGADWARRAVTPLVRGVLILAVGLVLGHFVSNRFVDVILPYLGLMFIASVILLPLRTKALVTIGLLWAVLSPVLSHVLRSGTTPTAPPNVTFTDLVTNPGATFTLLLLTGAFPVLTWMSYIAVGLGVGRAALDSRRVVARLIGWGAALLIAAESIAWLLVASGLRDRIAQDVAGHMTLDDFTEYMVWGGEGTLPTDSPWWLGLSTPHTGAPLDLLTTTAFALISIGVCITLATALGNKLRFLTAPGSMTLTLYSAHVLLLAPLSFLPDVVAFAAHIVILFTFALLWSSRFSKGPLEWVVAKITHTVEPARRPHRQVASA